MGALVLAFFMLLVYIAHANETYDLLFPPNACPKGVKCMDEKSFVFCEDNGEYLAFGKQLYKCEGQHSCDEYSPEWCLSEAVAANTSALDFNINSLQADQKGEASSSIPQDVDVVLNINLDRSKLCRGFIIPNKHRIPSKETIHDSFENSQSFVISSEEREEFSKKTETTTKAVTTEGPETTETELATTEAVAPTTEVPETTEAATTTEVAGTTETATTTETTVTEEVTTQIATTEPPTTTEAATEETTTAVVETTEAVTTTTLEPTTEIVTTEPAMIEIIDDSEEEEERINYVKYYRTESGIYTLTHSEKTNLLVKSIADITPSYLVYEEISIGGENFPTLHKNFFGALKPQRPIKISLLSDNIGTLEAGVLHGVKNLDEIDINFNKIRQIPIGVFGGLSIRVVNLEENRIKRIASGAFDNMPNLTEINLSGNRLTIYDPDWFLNTPNLLKLYFSYNSIEYIPNKAFKNLNLHKEVELYLDYNKIKSVHDYAFTRKPTDLESLDYYENIKLKVLILKGNQLKCLREQTLVAHFTTLRENKITCNCLSKISKFLETQPGKIVETEEEKGEKKRCYQS